MQLPQNEAQHIVVYFLRTAKVEWSNEAAKKIIKNFSGAFATK